MKTNKITMVNPGQIVKRGWKDFKTTQAVRNFATKYKVPSMYWKRPGTSRKIFLVEYDQFCEIYREYKKSYSKSSSHKPAKKRTSSKTNKTYKRSTTRKPIARKSTRRSTTRKPIARKSTKRSTSRKRTTYRAKSRSWGR